VKLDDEFVERCAGGQDSLRQLINLLDQATRRQHVQQIVV